MKRILYLFILTLGLQFAANAQYYGYDLSNIVITAGSTNPIDGISSIAEDQFTEDISLDVVNWNVNWLGAPQMNNNKFGTRNEHINNVAAKLVEINADVYALQEVVVDASSNAFDDLLTEMNRLAGDDLFDGVYSEYHSFYWQAADPDYPPQCLAYIWKKAVVSVNKSEALLKDYASYNDFGYGRLPFLLDANVTLNGKTQRYMFVNIHLKAMTGFSDMRASSMKLLKELLRVNYSKNNVILLGDFNVADKQGALGEIRDWGMYLDDDGDGIADFVHTAGNKNNGIEHTLISNELYDESAYAPEYFRNKAINGTGVILSDHYAYQTRLYVHEETGNVNPGTDELFSSGKYFTTMTTSDYQTIVDYVKNDPALAALDNSKYDDSEYYFGASSYYSNFDIRDGKHHSTFATWEDAIKTAISKALLPAKYPNAEANDSVYHVTFDTYNGTDKSYTFNFECTKSAPNPEFAFTTRTAVDLQELNTVSVYPNPANNVLCISGFGQNTSYAVLNMNGRTILKGLFDANNTNSLEISNFRSGLYVIIGTDEKGNPVTTKFIKQ